jgi:hypothetical protein
MYKRKRYASFISQHGHSFKPICSKKQHKSKNKAAIHGIGPLHYAGKPPDQLSVKLLPGRISENSKTVYRTPQTQAHITPTGNTLAALVQMESKELHCTSKARLRQLLSQRQF